MNTQAKSPIPNKAVETPKSSGPMNFFEALKEVLDGKKIHKIEWGSKEYFGFLKDNILTLHKPDGKNYQWIISDGDMTGVDWIVI